MENRQLTGRITLECHLVLRASVDRPAAQKRRSPDVDFA
jgi:hypothetical protein